MTHSRRRVAVVGAGIVGASIAYHLARRGAAVTLIDKGQPAGDVTGKAFGWVNVSHSDPEPALQLRHFAIQDYRRLELELGPALQVNWCGALTWSRDPAETERLVRGHAAWGYDIRLVGREEIAALEPNLIDPPDCAAFASSEAAIEPVAATEALVEAARKAGAEIRSAARVIGLDTKGHAISGIRTDDGVFDADVVVAAAGTGTAALCRMLDVSLPIDASPAVLLRFRSGGGLVKRIISCPDLEIRPGVGDALLGAEDFGDGMDLEAIAQATLASIKQRLRGADAVETQDARVGMRPIPGDGLPIIGFASRIEGLYVAAMHAGVTLAPVVGRFAATEILDDIAVRALESCRLERFQG